MPVSAITRVDYCLINSTPHPPVHPISRHLHPTSPDAHPSSPQNRNPAKSRKTKGLAAPALDTPLSTEDHCLRMLLLIDKHPPAPTRILQALAATIITAEPS